MNVGGTTIADAGSLRFDLVVTALTAYRAADAALNGLNGRFAQINFAANTQTDLRVRVFRSCCSVPNCVACADSSLSGAEQTACYARGCCCFGRTCTTGGCCSGAQRESWRGESRYMY